jgi:hemolysin
MRLINKSNGFNIKKNKVAILLASLISISLSAPAYSLEKLTDFATNANIDIKSINYINLSGDIINQRNLMKQRKDNNTPFLEFSEITRRVLGRGEIFLFDFSGNKSEQGLGIAKAEFRKMVSPISFKENAVVVSRYNGKVMLTPVNTDKADEFLDIFHRVEQESILSDVALETDVSAQSDFYKQVPMIEQYINAKFNIRCSMENFTQLGDLCRNGSADLKYLVTMASSKKAGVINNAKFLRITFGDSAQGAGITLNESMKTVHSETVGNDTKHLSSPFIGSANFKVGVRSSSNTGISVFNSFPENINPSSQVSEEVKNTFSLTLAGDPKNISASGTITTERSHRITNESREYKITKRLTNNGSDRPNIINEAQFSWDREMYNTAKDHMKWYGIVNSGNRSDPLKYDNISIMAYRNFMPRFDATFVNETVGKGGIGEFYVKYNINPVSILSNGNVLCSMYGCNTKFSGVIIKESGTVSLEQPIEIDWDHPIFTGRWPVNLQLAGVEAKCLSLNENITSQIGVVTCNLTTDYNQGFFMDQQGRYQSVSKSDYCLQRNYAEVNKKDVSIGRCSNDATLRQYWQWDGEKLLNKLFNEQLFINPTNNELILAATKPNNSFMAVAYSRFLDLFNSIKI